MKFCTNCGKQLDDEIRFCTDCGTPLDAALLAARDRENMNQEKSCLDLFYRFFKYERLSWKISGIVMLVFCLYFLVFGCLFSILPAAFGAEDIDLAILISLGVMYIMFGILFLPIAILSLKMVKRCDYYMNTLYSDAEPMVKRCNSVGMIVLGAIFNTVAMAFIIVNFVRAKNNAAQLQQIIARQKAYRSGNSN